MRRSMFTLLAVVLLAVSGRATATAQESPAPSPVPPAQRRFAVAVSDWCRQFLDRPDNPIAAEQANRRALQQIGVITGRVGPIQSWNGILVRIEPYTRMTAPRGQDGTGATLMFSVDSTADIRVTQYQDTIPPTAVMKANVGSSSALYAAAGRMSVGQRVLFSGRALQAEQTIWLPYGGETAETMRNTGEPAGCRAPFTMQLTALRSAP